MERVEKIQALCDVLTKAWETVQTNPNLRYGQALFNTAHHLRSELVNKVVGTELDPFYCENPNDPKIYDFCDWLVENW